MSDSLNAIEAEDRAYNTLVDRAYRLSNQWVDVLNRADAVLAGITSTRLAEALDPEAPDIAELHSERQSAERVAHIARELIRVADEVQAACKVRIWAEGRSATELAAQAHQQRRAERLAQRPEPAPEAPRPRCITCNKKPRSIDDYCKKCAREAGIVVRGKIGEA